MRESHAERLAQLEKEHVLRMEAAQASAEKTRSELERQLESQRSAHAVALVSAREVKGEAKAVAEIQQRWKPPGASIRRPWKTPTAPTPRT